MRTYLKFLATVLVLPSLLQLAVAQTNLWVEGTNKSSGATSTHYNRAAGFKWQHPMGDWIDVTGQEQGSQPYATARIKDTNKARFIEWDVSSLVHNWHQGKHPNLGFVLKFIDGRGTVDLRSKETDDPAQRPQLVIRTKLKTITLNPQADTLLTASTSQSLGYLPKFKISDSHNVLLYFNLTNIPHDAKIKSAVLRLYTIQAIR